MIDTCWTISNSKGQALKMATKELKDVNVDLGKVGNISFLIMLNHYVNLYVIRTNLFLARKCPLQILHCIAAWHKTKIRKKETSRYLQQNDIRITIHPSQLQKLCEKLETIPAFAEGITVGQNFLSS